MDYLMISASKILVTTDMHHLPQYLTTAF